MSFIKKLGGGGGGGGIGGWTIWVFAAAQDWFSGNEYSINSLFIFTLPTNTMIKVIYKIA